MKTFRRLSYSRGRHFHGATNLKPQNTVLICFLLLSNIVKRLESSNSSILFTCCYTACVRDSYQLLRVSSIRREKHLGFVSRCHARRLEYHAFVPSYCMYAHNAVVTCETSSSAMAERPRELDQPFQRGQFEAKL